MKNFQQQKLDIVKKILDTKNKAVLSQVQLILQQENDNSDLWDEFSDEAKLQIEKSIKESEEGKLISHKAAREKIKKWL